METAALLAAVADLRPGLVAVPAFLDLAEPDLTAAVRAMGVDSAVVLPLLFTEAFHTRVDVPAAVAAASSATGADLLTGAHLGMGSGVLAALRTSAADAGIADNVEILLLAVGSSDAAANREVESLAQRWAAQRSGPVRAAFATTEPRAATALDGPEFGGAVVPLFAANGLLLDAVRRQAADRRITVASPLGVLLAGLVLRRYDEALAARHRCSPA